MTRTTGIYERTNVGDEVVGSFIPKPLPPADPQLELNAPARELLRSAEEGLRRLDLAGEMVPSLDWFLYGFVRAGLWLWFLLGLCICPRDQILLIDGPVGLVRVFL